MNFLAPTVLLAPIVLAAAMVCAPAHAQAVRTERNVSLELANQIAAAGVAACTANGYAVTVTVVDRAGGVRAVQRADNAGPHTLAASQQKAFTSASAKNTTLAMMEAAQKNPAAANLVYIPGYLLLGGGVPVKVGNEVIGAVGVGGAPGGHLDEQCATAALDKVKELLELKTRGTLLLIAAAAAGLHRAGPWRRSRAEPGRDRATTRACTPQRSAAMAPASTPAAQPKKRRCWKRATSSGRTPLHVATFAQSAQRGEGTAGKAGADSASLENGRYDAVTIAAVADDEETLRAAASGRCEREADDQSLRRHRADRRCAPRATTAWCGSSSRPARRSTTSTTCIGPR